MGGRKNDFYSVMCRVLTDVLFHIIASGWISTITVT